MRRHRLNWPEGAANRRSAKAVAKMTGLEPLLSSLGEESLQVRGLVVRLLVELHAGALNIMFLLCTEKFSPARIELQ